MKDKTLGRFSTGFVVFLYFVIIIIIIILFFLTFESCENTSMSVAISCQVVCVL